MKKQEIQFKSSNGVNNIRVVKYIPDNKPKAILQIAHGMVEFIDRYDDFAKYLCDRDILVVGNDHLGHGGSVNNEADWGYFGNDGNERILYDLNILTQIIKAEYADTPYFLLGHSMGSFYAREYLGTFDGLSGAIIMGTGMEPLMTIKSGMALCKILAIFKGWRYRSNLVNNIAFGSYNKKFEPARTKMDWLTKDEKIVDWYLNEPRCTFVFTLDGYYNMFKCISKLYDKKVLSNIPKDLPILFVSGKDDPVGTFGKEVEKSVESLKAYDIKNIEMKLYENDRHEILNETDRLDVYEDIYLWISKNLFN